MFGSAAIAFENLLFFSMWLLIPAVLLYEWRLVDLGRTVITSTLRMTAQLLLVGFYLRYLFELNHPLLNLCWLSVMVTVANISIVQGAGLSARRLFWVTQMSLVFAIGTVTTVFLLVLVKPVPFMDARYLIPIAGMLLGNCLQGNIRAMETFYGELRANQPRYLSDLLLGATVAEAVQPFFRRAVRSALAPAVGTMATVGVVFLPGMMTGQILGGAYPLVAAKYQIAIMVGIFLSMVCAISLNLRLSLMVCFDDQGLLKESIFTRQAD